MANKSLRDWDTKLSHAEFAYNRTLSYAIFHSLFEVCYGLNPLTFLNLIPIPQESNVSFEAEEIGKEMKKLNEQVRTQIDKVNEQYKSKANNNHTHFEFTPGDLVCLHLIKERISLKKEE